MRRDVLGRRDLHWRRALHGRQASLSVIHRSGVGPKAVRAAREARKHDRSDHQRPRRAGAQPQERLGRVPARFADRDHRAQRVRQVVARLRHHLRRGPAPIRGVPFGLCAPVSRADAEARRGFHRRAFARHLHRAENHVAQPAVHRRHGDRDLRLHAAIVRARRRPPFPRHRASHRKPDREPDGRQGLGDAGRNPASSARAHRPRAQGGISKGGPGSPEARLPAPQGGRLAVRDRRGSGAGQEAQARHRSGGGPARGPRRPGAASRRQLRDCARALGRPRVFRGRGIRRTGHVLGQIRVPDLGLHHRRDRAPAVLFQQSLRGVPGLRRARDRDVLRPRLGGPRRPPLARGRCHRALGELVLAVLRADPRKPRCPLRPIALHAGAQAPQAAARDDPIRLG